MDMLVFGLNHRTAPLEVRERWAFSGDEARRALQGIQDVVSPAENLILSTCHRTEIYALLPSGESPPGLNGRRENGGDGFEDLIDFFHGLKNCRREKNLSHFYNFREQAAVEHLFRLAGGLDSMILGEGQILRQLRDAFELAREAGSIGKVFQRLFPAAIRAGKRTRAETGIAQGCITHGQAAVRIARETVGDLSQKHLLLLGSGKVSRLVAEGLRELGARRITVVNRTMENAVQLARRLDGGALPLQDLPRLLEMTDLVISSTGATRPLVDGELLSRICRRRQGRPLCIIDLAVPRDFEPSCAEVEGVTLYNIDQLSEVVQSNLEGRLTEVPRAESIVQEEMRAFLGQMNWIHLDPVIRHIMERFEAIRAVEVERHIAAIPPEHRGTVEALTQSLLKKLLHFPIEKLKSLRDYAGLTPAEIAFLQRLFLPEIKAPHAIDGCSPPNAPDREPR